jgi:tetratricopeptide (TPR) repeat protein
VAYDSQGKYFDAVEAYNEALEIDPNQPMVLINLAVTFMKQERWPNARSILQRAVEVDPRLVMGYERLGYCYFRLRRYTDARDSYQMALQLKPGSAEAHAGLGAVQMVMYLRDPDNEDLRHQAVEHWNKSLKIKPDQPKIRDLVDKYGPTTGPSTAGALGGN